MTKILTRLLSFSLIYTYRKKIILITVNLIIVILAIFIYSDVVEFLKSNSLSNYLVYALLGKWLIIIISVSLIAYSLMPAKKQPKTIVNATPEVPLSPIEQHIKSKAKLKSHGDMIIEEARQKKGIY